MFFPSSRSGPRVEPELRRWVLGMQGRPTPPTSSRLPGAVHRAWVRGRLGVPLSRRHYGPGAGPTRPN
ncbi:hypothetical protein DPEC_G00327460 [Dallia pectoralis]|uniref:Uncharacterized protein n=1 Tax=Dallia pectoralis TaxID=75939 RepID=A0ACC2F816_DALPE|nr:hypothetical protein DPEC_G00327460 [Dallia pectoralis]